MAELSGKVAIVTGSGQGVGRGIALALARAGAAVAIVGRRVENTSAVAKEIEALGVRSAAFQCDVKDAASIQSLVASVSRQLGGIDILVNNAQQVPLGPLLSIEDEAFQAGFASGPLATLRLMKACHPFLKRSGEGVIVNLATSAAVRWDMSGYGAYGAVKEATRILTRAAAAEWGPDGIRVLTIAPHADSPALKGWVESRPEEAAAFFETIPLRRIGRCEEDIGAAVAALCGPAFSYFTGATVPLDGGQANFD
ncbi:SDR family oxidoreductase [Sphingomonas paeninsulae]|jgi:NAD(P)-dependent dehydrogenase (short-subunit alcohol dehydrogenase family)|uniref:SDR family oxidoreductase n=1 Tax=Sphingomonas paeninsulae TaxID=2319844 RepID=A0A494TMK5_SPHPE|nr:SDR family oxidoreductase [Sphingomonas paeninsulae]AYJ87061.1 SDR family oxidoreductase [Sphingomonas paeninsulae]